MRVAADIINIIVFTAIFVLAFAQEPAVMALLRRNYGGERAVTASFDLTIYWDVREREEKRAGEVVIAPGDRFKVTLGRETFVCDGTTYWHYNERNSQVVVRNFSDIDPSTLPSGMLASFLSGRQFNSERKGGGIVELSWSGDDGEHKEITVNVNETTGVINTLRLKDNNDNIHTYAFKKTAFDSPPRNNDAFRFRAPRGVDVMDMREN